MLRHWKFGGLLIINLLLALILSTAPSEAAQTAWCGPCYKGWDEGGAVHAGKYYEWVSFMYEEHPNTDAAHTDLYDGGCFDLIHGHICCDPGGGDGPVE